MVPPFWPAQARMPLRTHRPLSLPVHLLFSECLLCAFLGPSFIFSVFTTAPVWIKTSFYSREKAGAPQGLLSCSDTVLQVWSLEPHTPPLPMPRCALWFWSSLDSLSAEGLAVVRKPSSTQEHCVRYIQTLPGVSNVGPWSEMRQLGVELRMWGWAGSSVGNMLV